MMSNRSPDTLPYAVSLEEIPDIEALEDDTHADDPEVAVFSGDHTGVATALSLLTPRQRQILSQRAGLNELGMPLPREEIADMFGISVVTVDSTLFRARTRLRSAQDIVGIINGESILDGSSHNNSLQTS